MNEGDHWLTTDTIDKLGAVSMAVGVVVVCNGRFVLFFEGSLPADGCKSDLCVGIVTSRSA